MTPSAPRPARGLPAQTGPDRGPALGPDEVRILRLLSQGLTVELIARRLDISERTVRRKVRAIGDALGGASTIEAIVWAVRRGII